MTDSNFTGGTRRDLTKYRATFAVALVALVGAAWITWQAYQEHIDLLNSGDTLTKMMEQRGIAVEGADHER